MKSTPPYMTKNARILRSNMTDAEQKLWHHLRMRQIHGLKFRRQHPVGKYILDFACISIKLAIELDGGQHTKQQDAARTQTLQQKGWTILRFWNHQVLQETQAVLASIATSCKIAVT